ncbi:MAG: PSD1 domain-containing protein [Verrucomicrobiales bacterium]|nr:PSD1 domain-containing protein [Verrucomicrobiales bacterium]
MTKPSAAIRVPLLGLLATLRVLAAAPAPVPADIQYNRDVRPILSDTCFHCHGPDKNARKGKLRLDIREEALARKAFVPGDPASSELVKRLFSTDPEELMPPPDAHKPLTPEQKETLRRWVASGAEYQPHWAYLPLRRPPLPGGRTASGNSASPIDLWVRSRLARQGLDLSPPADRRTLLRRLSLDLTGLPPTPAEVDAFLTDTRSGAYERQVERLLKSPHYGERMAVPWLDVVRYADTVGYHGDQNINVFPYRDYVIAAFNANLPFDRFTREQLAGDLMPEAGMDARIATGFNRLNMVTREGGAQPREYLAKYQADRVRTVAMAWLGSTMGCAECHDHKFDPFTQRDFYSLGAFFADVRQWGVYNDYDYTPNPDLKGWSNDHPFPPELEVVNESLALRAARYADQLEAISDSIAASATGKGVNHTAFTSWEAFARRFLTEHPDGWATPVPIPADGATNATVSASGDVTVLRPSEKPEKTGLPRLRIPLPAGGLAAVRVELLPVGTNGITFDGKSTTLRPSFRIIRPSGLAGDLGIHHAEATLSEARYANGHQLVGIRDNWKTSAGRALNPHTSVWVLRQPQATGDGEVLEVGLGNNAVQSVRISVTPFAAANPLKSGASVELVDALSRPAARRSDRDRRELAETWLLSTDDNRLERERFQAAHWGYLSCRSGRVPAVVTAAWEPMTMRVLARGNWMDESGEIVTPNPPAFLPRGGLPTDRRLTRLDLADWILSPENPLTARVFVNRLWKQFFGAGLSAQVEDLGAQGEWPTHPELLDWLASEFRDSGWDVKHMVRRIVLSDTYRQQSNLRPETRESDPSNRWLASQNPRRLDAEFVRDNALFIAGLLNPERGGPPVFPYQPPGYYANLQFPDRDYLPSPGDSQFRRGVYAHWQRTFLNPMLANFDAPSREECTASRPVSNTPQQALTLLNDPTFVEASRGLAERLLRSEPREDSARIRRAFELALARPPKPAEIESLNRFLIRQREEGDRNPAAASRFLRVGTHPIPPGTPEPELAAWTELARVILNLQETVTRY